MKRLYALGTLLAIGGLGLQVGFGLLTPALITFFVGLTIMVVAVVYPTKR